MSDKPPPFAFDPRLESLRGLAALWVGLSHGFATYALTPAPASLAQVVVETLFGAMTPAGSVMFFFVLSGYVVGRSFQQSLNLTAYAIRRIFRLIPPFAAAVMFAFVVIKVVGPAAPAPGMSDSYLQSFGTDFTLQHVWDNLLFRNSLVNGPTWSIYPEIIGSTVLPFLVLAHAYVDSKWRWALFLTLCTLLAFSQIRFVLWFYVGFFAATECAVFIGTRKILAVLSFTIGLVALGRLSIDPVYYKAATVIPSAIAAGLMIAAVASHRDFMTWLEWKPLRFLGKVSFSFYLLHWPIFYLCSLPVLQRPELFGTGFNANLVIALTSIAATLIVATLAHEWIERPFIDLGRYLSGRVPVLKLEPRKAA